MTVRTRNMVFLGICLLALLIAVGTIFGGFIFFYKAAGMISVTAVREFAFLDSWMITAYSRTGLFLSVFLIVLLQPIIIGSIFFYFEKTRTREVFFLVIFAAACSFEGFRFVVPIVDFFAQPFYIAVVSSKLVLFGRILAPLALLCAALSTSDIFSGQSDLSVLLILLLSFLASSNIPINSMIRLSTLFYQPGYYWFIEAMTVFCGILSPCCYAISSRTQNIREYAEAAVGCAATYCGYWLLIHSDCLLFTVFGIVLFILGIQRLIKSTHNLYKWN